MDQKISAQSGLVTKLKRFAVETNTAVFIVVHTRKDVVDNMGRLMTENDIRGNSSLVNMAHFFYIMQRFETPNAYFQTIRIAKSRGQTIDKKLFVVNYDRDKVLYYGDTPIDFSAFKKIFKERNQL